MLFIASVSVFKNIYFFYHNLSKSYFFFMYYIKFCLFVFRVRASKFLFLIELGIKI